MIQPSGSSCSATSCPTRFLFFGFPRGQAHELGTATIVEIGDAHALVTAGHVVENKTDRTVLSPKTAMRTSLGWPQSRLGLARALDNARVDSVLPAPPSGLARDMAGEDTTLLASPMLQPYALLIAR